MRLLRPVRPPKANLSDICRTDVRQMSDRCPTYMGLLACLPSPVLLPGEPAQVWLAFFPQVGVFEPHTWLLSSS